MTYCAHCSSQLTCADCGIVEPLTIDDLSHDFKDCPKKTTEIEELPVTFWEPGMRMMADKIDELVRAVNKLNKV